jgi:hypothetical protein
MADGNFCVASLLSGPPKATLTSGNPEWRDLFLKRMSQRQLKLPNESMANTSQLFRIHTIIFLHTDIQTAKCY